MLLFFLQMPGALLPLVLLPDVCFTDLPVGLTMAGQYFVKDMVRISAALVIGRAVRGGLGTALTLGRSHREKDAQR